MPVERIVVVTPAGAPLRKAFTKWVEQELKRPRKVSHAQLSAFLKKEGLNDVDLFLASNQDLFATLGYVSESQVEQIATAVGFEENLVTGLVSAEYRRGVVKARRKWQGEERVRPSLETAEQTLEYVKAKVCDLISSLPTEQQVEVAKQVFTVFGKKVETDGK